MLPQSEAESRTCTKIATAFKNAMLPSHRGGDSQTAPSMLFGYPDEFEITFKVNGVNSSGTLFVLPITQPAITDFKIGDLLLIERGHASSPDGLNPNGSTLAKNEDQNLSLIHI